MKLSAVFALCMLQFSLETSNLEEGIIGHVLQGKIVPKKKAKSIVLGILIPQFQPPLSPVPSRSQFLRPPVNV